MIAALFHHQRQRLLLRACREQRVGELR